MLAFEASLEEQVETFVKPQPNLLSG